MIDEILVSWFFELESGDVRSLVSFSDLADLTYP